MFNRTAVTGLLGSANVCVFLQVARCEDHVGFSRLSSVLAQLEGAVIPMSALLTVGSDKHVCLQSSIGYLLSSKQRHRLVFPVTDGILQWEQGGGPPAKVVVKTFSILCSIGQDAACYVVCLVS